MMQSEQKIYGGMFGRNSGETSTAFAPVSEKNIYFINARSAIFSIAEKLGTRNVWLPSFLCPTIVQAIQETEARVNFYPVSQSLEVGSNDWIDKVCENDLVLFIHYFGFLQNSFPLQAVRNKKARIIQDASQALFTQGLYKDEVDFTVYSPRKLFPCPAGGILSHGSEINFEENELSQVPDSFDELLKKTMDKKTQFDRHGEDNQWFLTYKELEQEQPIGSYVIDSESRECLRAVPDLEQSKNKRKRNFSLLLEHLEDYAVFKTLPGNTVPLGFPIIIPDREEVLRKLYSQKIYLPVHWRLQDKVPKEFTESHKLSESICTVICDQRYSESDMYFIASEIKQIIDEVS